MNIIEIMPRNSAISSICLDDSIVRAQYKTGSVPCQGLFAAGISDTMSYYANGVDAGYYTAYAVSGLGAPMDEFPQLQETLSQSLASFRYSEEYIRQGVQNIEAGTEAALAAGRTLSQASDSYNQAFHSRNRVKDTNMQKWSDGQLGYDRVMIRRPEKSTGQSWAFTRTMIYTVRNTQIPIWNGCPIMDTTYTIKASQDISVNQGDG